MGLFIKGLSLPVKIAAGVISGGIVIAGATTATVVTIHNNTQSNSNNNVSQSEQSATTKTEDGQDKEPELAETTEKDTAGEESADAADKQTSSSSSNQPESSKKIDKASTTTNNSASTTNVSNSSHDTSTSTSNATNNTSTTPAKKPDYNLNDRYVAGYVEYVVNSKLEGDECKAIDTVSFLGIAKYRNGYSDLWDATRAQYDQYIKTHGYNLECGGLGFANMTWEEVVARGIALDEAKCASYGLSCGRW